ncbi:MAG: DUF927 domain-containing protein [Pseudomonadota bacterium]
MALSSSTALITVEGEWDKRAISVSGPLEGTVLLRGEQEYREVTRPGFCMHPGAKPFGKPGLWWHTHCFRMNEEGKKERVPHDIWVCSPLEVIANTHDEHDDNYGMQLQFLNRAGRWRHWTIPRALLTKRNMNLLCQELLKQGVTLSTQRGATELLLYYLMEVKPNRWLEAAIRTGWHGEPGDKRFAFILPDCTIGCQDVVFQGATNHSSGFGEKGTLKGWQHEIGAYCVGNVNLQASVCLALAGPLIRELKCSPGVHFVGPTSVGKSTALRVASSAWGSGSTANGFVRSWKSTENGLEAIAAERNDTFLPLDEIGEADERTIGKTVYALSNGVGKVRADVNGKARETATWRTPTLSTGESSLNTLIKHQGGVSRGGQDVRQQTIPVIGEHGIFDTLHGFSGGADLSRHLEQASTQHYGKLGPAFVEVLVRKAPDQWEEIRKAHRMASKVIADGVTDGFALRAADALAVAAVAGEIAIEEGLLPWPPDSAIHAMSELFQRWLQERGNAHSEDTKVLDAIEGFIVAHADSRFSPRKDTTENSSSGVRDRAGWYVDSADGRRVYLFTKDAFDEALKPTGIERSRAIRILSDAEWVHATDKGNRNTKKTRIPGHGNLDLYWLCPPCHLSLHQGGQVAS